MGDETTKIANIFNNLPNYVSGGVLNPISPGNRQKNTPAPISKNLTLNPFLKPKGPSSAGRTGPSVPRLKLNLYFRSDSADPTQSIFSPSEKTLKFRDKYAEPRWVSSTYLVFGGASVLGGFLLYQGSKDDPLRRGMGGGLATFGAASLTYDLLDKLEGPRTMPRWLKNTGAIGVGIIAGLAVRFFGGGFDQGGVGDNPSRNGVDEYGP